MQRDPVGKLLLFGATGDLAARMLLPSLYGLDGDGLLPDQLRVVGGVFLDKPLNGLNIFNRPAGPDQRSHLRS